MDDLLYTLKEYRKAFAAQLEFDITRELVHDLADTHTAILAIEAIMNEPEPEKTGPDITFDENGWPI